MPGEPIPEPATLLLFAGGLLVLGIRAWTRRA
ncbi:MAG: PEP-CTERM sorting domain-containing protein [Planctomycetes bacterium]|nr:PEP-CTERM sorting domain-containing protein [Planctomycetota bacterium]